VRCRNARRSWTVCAPSVSGSELESTTARSTSASSPIIGGPEPQQYSGFFGQVERGWDGLVSVAGHFVMRFGLLLPWFGVLAVVCGIGYGLLRLVRARRS
jgi:hypothetical protein